MAKLNSSTSTAADDAQSRWERAIERLRAVEEEFTSISLQHSAAFGAAAADCPREEQFFRQYNLGVYKDAATARERNFRAALMNIVTERCKELGRLLTDEEAKEAATEADRVVDNFAAWLNRRNEAGKRHDCDAWEERFDAAADKRWEAQQAVLNAEAPDLKAMLLKLEMLTELMDGEQDQQRVAAIRDDAKRLLS